MKSILKLNNPLWQTPARRAILDKTVQQSGAELESRIKQKILTGPKSGKTYRRSAIKNKVAKRDLGFYRSNRKVFKRTFSGLDREKTTVGYQFHKASAKGESPANDTGGLANATRSKKTGEMRNQVANSKKYAKPLDDPNGLNRPFFASTAEEFKPKFKQNIADAIRENS